MVSRGGSNASHTKRIALLCCAALAVCRRGARKEPTSGGDGGSRQRAAHPIARRPREPLLERVVAHAPHIAHRRGGHCRCAWALKQTVPLAVNGAAANHKRFIKSSCCSSTTIIGVARRGGLLLHEGRCGRGGESADAASVPAARTAVVVEGMGVRCGRGRGGLSGSAAAISGRKRRSSHHSRPPSNKINGGDALAFANDHIAGVKAEGLRHRQ